MHDYMSFAVEEANKAFFEGNVPIGAVIVHNGVVISSCHNTKNTTNIAINHAEILCIVEACKYFKSWYLSECDIYVTLKPCDMCLNALAECRIRNVYYLLESNYGDNLLKNKSSILFTRMSDNYNYGSMLSSFFSNIRE